MADVNMNIGNQPLPAEVQAYITNLQAQLAAVQAGQNMGQQRIKPSKPTRFNGALGQIPQYGCSYSSNMPSYPM